MSESEVRNKMASDLAKENLIRAREAGDYTKEECISIEELINGNII